MKTKDLGKTFRLELSEQELLCLTAYLAGCLPSSAEEWAVDRGLSLKVPAGAYEMYDQLCDLLQINS